MSERQTQPGQVLIAAALGAVVGFVAGVLLAPKSGRETREQLRHGAEEAAHKAKHGYETIKDKATHTAQQLRRRKDQLAEDLEASVTNPES